MAILVPIAFVAGLITAFTPCILPVLPIVLAGGAEGTRRRPYAIVAGLVTTFTLFTLAGAWIFHELNVPAKYQTQIGAAMLLVVALTLIVRKAALAFRTHAATVRIAAGILMAAAAVVISAHWAEDLQKSVPGYVASIQRALEGNHATRKQLARLQGRNSRQHFARAEPTKLPEQELATRIMKVPLGDYGAAPDFHGISHWLNSKPLSLASLSGHVVLVDFWTYSCINCLRTLPHLEQWYRAYHSKGFVIVGVHTPEFDFEHDYGNVRDAVSRLGVRYPVAMDNDYATWNAYQNQYWPAEYLIDQRGEVRHLNFGEGDYGKTAKDIRLLLQAGGSDGPSCGPPLPRSRSRRKRVSSAASVSPGGRFSSSSSTSARCSSSATYAAVSSSAATASLTCSL